MLIQIVGLITVTIAGGLLPLLAKRSQRLLHLFVAFATGLFLGVVFLHFLPEALASTADGLRAPWPGALVLFGVVALYCLQSLVLPGRTSGDQHVTAGWGSFFGLGVHALAAGISLAAVDESLDPAHALFASFVVHKAAEGFSLATVFRLTGASTKRVLALVGAFACVTPLGLVLGSSVLDHLSATGTQAFTALAAGTFLFVALVDLLPEVFHGRRDVAARLAVLAAGVSAAWLVHMLEG